MKHTLLLLISLMLTSPCFGAKGLVNDAPWNTLLDKYVTWRGHQSFVDYEGLKNNPGDRALFYSYIHAIENVKEDAFERASVDRQLAFLINTYNAFIVKLVIENYPLESIRDLNFLFFDPWDRKLFTLFGEEHSLDDIEEDMINDEFDDPRTTFALSNASKDGPPLLPEAYTAKRLEVQLNKVTYNFINDPEKNYYDEQRDILHLSKIFKWHDDNIEDHSDSVMSFVAPYFDIDDTKHTDIEYLDYDWSLNE